METSQQTVTLPLKKTKIVCTIGPASSSQEVLEQLIARGMNIARINFAHGDFESHRQACANIRAAGQAVGRRVSIFGDLPGPKMRIGKLAQEPIDLERGQPFILQNEEIEGDQTRVSHSFPKLPQVVKPGDSIFLNDGYIQLDIEEVVGQEIHSRVVVGGELRSFKGINLPGIDLGISAFTEADHKFLGLAAELGLDGVSQSFVENAADIQAVRAAAAELGYDPFIIAKVERSRALDNLDEIIASSDGIMVARGDLGVEIPVEKVTTVQKEIIDQANLSGTPVITATHMLESMTDHRRPTRAEASDVANAILDGTDCVMLSGETAVGSFPVDAVDVMSRIAREVESKEREIGIGQLLELQRRKGEIGRDDLISLSVFLAAEALEPDLIFIPARTGATARRLCRFKPNQWVVSATANEATCQRLQFSYGIFPVYLPGDEIDHWKIYARDWLVEQGLLSGLVLVVEGEQTPGGNDITRIEIIEIE